MAEDVVLCFAIAQPAFCFAGRHASQEEATLPSHQHQQCKFRGITDGAGHWPSTAEKIIQTRKSHGAFKEVNDLLAIRGIGEKRLEKMRKYLTVGKQGQGKSQHGTAQATVSGKAKAPPRNVPAKSPPLKKDTGAESEEEEP